ncbi:MAG TPA: zf-HC2 domain-containing protein [Haliangiales bacterium]|nr:zf-HC2 domain-containing protein [Haliangiales bacterium]
MMQCRDIDELMVDFLYQELGEPQAKAFEEHVHDCARCEAELASLARTRQALRAIPQLEPSPAVSARLLHEAARRAPKVAEERVGILARLREFFAPLARHPAWVGAAASVLLVAGLASVLTLRRDKGMAPAGVTTASKAEPVRPADEGARAGESDKAKEAGRFDQPVVAAAPPEAEEAKPGATPAVAPAPVAKSKTVATKFRASTDIDGLADTRDAKLRPDRTGRTSTPREEKSLREAAADKTVAPSRYKTEDGYLANKDTAGGKGGDAKHADDLERAQTVTGEITVPDATKEGKLATRAPADRPAPTQEGQKGLESRGAQQAPANDLAQTEQRKAGTVGGAAPTGDRRAAAAPAAPAPEPAPPPPKALQTANAEPEAPANQKTQAAANQAPKQYEQKQAPAKPSPPSQSAELHQQARKQASAGACPEALALRDKISRVDPTYFQKNVAGDPAFRGCMDQQQRAKAVKKAPAPAQSAPRLNDNVDAAEKNENKAAH